MGSKVPEQPPSNEREVSLLVDPGTASAEEIAEFLAELSKLYRMMGGSGIQFSQEESRCTEGEFV